ncbi:MAG: hypothetical protein RIF34_10320, partial [Candidatus Kapaibacterium sp.]
IVLNVNSKKKRIDKSTPLLYQAKLSDYQDGDDLILRKRPGRMHNKPGGGMTGSTRQRSSQSVEDVETTNNAKKLDANHNSTRSNRSTYIDDDDDGDSIDDDCDDAEISVSSKGNGRVEITVTILK